VISNQRGYFLYGGGQSTEGLKRFMTTYGPPWCADVQCERESAGSNSSDNACSRSEEIAVPRQSCRAIARASDKGEVTTICGRGRKRSWCGSW
jgi:hypothetical protein